MSDRDTARLCCQALESREVPTVDPLLSESFETVTAPLLPNGTSWSSNTSNGYITSKLAASDGKASLASLGDIRTESRFWFTPQMPADAGVSANVRSDNAAPMAVFTRAQGLNGTSNSYLAARLGSSGRQLDVVEVSNNATRVLSSVKVNSPAFGQWYKINLQPLGGRVTAQLQRLDTNQFLDGAGNWQAVAVNAVQTETTLPAVAGQVGVQRSTGGSGMVFVDSLTVMPSPSLGFKTNFDTNTPTGSPGDWLRWSNDSTAGFQTSSARSLSPSNSFASTGQSNTSTRAWLREAQPADVLASVYVYADGLIPVTLIARGSNLDTNSPSYYGVSIVRGLEARLVKMVNGVETTLATIKSTNWVSSTWLRLTLVTSGDQLRAVISRADTEQYLTPNGTWQDTPSPSLSATDRSLSTGGGVGLARPARFAGTVAVDDVEVRPAPSISGPRVTITASQPTSSVRGDVTFTVTGNPEAPPSRVEYRLNGRTRSSAATVNSSWTLDSTTLNNGSYTLTVWAVDETGNASTTDLNFTIANPNTTPEANRPDLPNKYEHIRIAALAYNGNPMSTFEQARLADSVDLVIPNPKYQQTIQTVSPDTTQLLYSNVSNLYLDLLTDWLGYADKIGASRELAFYHVTQPTAFTGSSPSAQPVNWFWHVSRGTSTGTLTDFTSSARSGTSTGIALNTVGETLAIGYTDEFRELNFTLNKAAGTGFQATLEYVSAVNADGTPRTWSTLPILSDGTNMLRLAGKVQFDPPQNWIASRLRSGGDLLFYVRYRVTAGTSAVAPNVRTILGRDYVGANGTTQGTIPSFDYTADKDGDGYLNDTEYANRKAGNNARFVYESRLFYPYYGQMRFATNPASTAVRRWAADYHDRLLDQYPLADGLFLDNSNGRLPIGTTPVVEPTAGYNEDYAGLIHQLIQAVSPKVVFSNTAGGNADATPIASASTGVLEEFLLRPTEATWATVIDLANLVDSRLNADDDSPYTILDTHPGSTPLNDVRMRSATLAYYYLLADPDRTMLMLYGGYSPAGSWQQTWIPAVSTNVGKPEEAMRGFASGNDPENTALGYRVFAREYENALVLYKPKSYTLGVGSGTLSTATATTHQLGGNYRQLNPDGTLGPVITQISLRNGDGVVLMKA